MSHSLFNQQHLILARPDTRFEHCAVGLILMDGLKLLAHEPRRRIIPLEHPDGLSHQQIYPVAQTQMLKLVDENHAAVLLPVLAAHHHISAPAERCDTLVVGDDHDLSVISAGLFTARYYAPESQPHPYCLEKRSSHTGEIDPQKHRDPQRLRRSDELALVSDTDHNVFKIDFGHRHRRRGIGHESACPLGGRERRKRNYIDEP